MRTLLLAAAVLTAVVAGCGGSAGTLLEPSGRKPRAKLVVDDRRRGWDRHLRLRRGLRQGHLSSTSRASRPAPKGSTGAVENLMRLRDGKLDIALTLGDTALDAIEGREAFDEPVPLAALAQIYRSYVQVVALKDSGIRALSDLKGKRVSVGSADSGTGKAVSDRVGAGLHRLAQGHQARAARRAAESAAALAERRARRLLLVGRAAHQRRLGPRARQARDAARRQRSSPGRGGRATAASTRTGRFRPARIRAWRPRCRRSRSPTTSSSARR